MAAAPFTIRPARAADLPGVREMLEEYEAWISRDLGVEDFQADLQHLPGDYAPPSGALLVATLPPDDRFGAVVGLRRHDATTCEMKRLYVRPGARGLGLGAALVERVLDEARHRRYQTLVLDTLPAMHDAQRLYERLGFHDISPYHNTAVPGSRFMALALSLK